MHGLTKAIETIGTSFEEFKKVNDERLAALDKGKDSVASDLNEKLGRIEKSVSEATKAKTEIEAEIKFQRDRLEDLEARASQPGKTSAQIVSDEYKGKFVEWVRHKGTSPMLET